jgi:hypothetical protein
VKRIVDKVAIATGKERERSGSWSELPNRKAGTGVRFEFLRCGGRTWVGSEADYLRASKAVTVVALRTNKEGRDVGGRIISPTLEAGDVYVLSASVLRVRCDAICYSVSSVG